MRIGIIGAGEMGGTLARLLAGVGHDVTIANSGAPETLPDDLLGVDGITGATAAGAARAGQVVFEAVPFDRHEQLPAQALRGRILVSVSNHDRDGDIDLEGRADTQLVAEHVDGADVVKAFNTIPAADLATQGDTDLDYDDRRVIAFCGDDQVAKDVVVALIDELGFCPADTGTLQEGGHVQHPGSPIFGDDLRGAAFDAALEAATN